MNIILEIKTIGDDGNPRYHIENELIVSSINYEQLHVVIDKHEAGGAKVHTCVISEELPFDEGYQAAQSGGDSDNNPYAEHHWKHNEWRLGWSAMHESD